VLDDTNGGGDVVRIEGCKVASGHPAANGVPAYAEKYSRQIRRSFGTAEVFAQDYAVSPHRDADQDPCLIELDHATG
jgi:hypothetical protein